MLDLPSAETSKIFLAVLSSGQCFVVDLRHDEVKRDELIYSAPVEVHPETEVVDESQNHAR